MRINPNNGGGGGAVVFPKKKRKRWRPAPLGITIFTARWGLICPPAATCSVGDPNQPGVLVGSPVVLFNNLPVIDYSQPQVGGYSYTYTDPNDPTGAANDVRWAVVTVTNGTVAGRRIIVGSFRRGMKTPTYPVSLDTMVSK